MGLVVQSDGGNAGQDLVPYKLYAIRYARHDGRTAHENFLSGDPHEAGVPLDYFIWLARRGDEVVVIDTGFGATAAAARGRTLLRDPVEALALMGVDAAQVACVILTHLHYDHAGSLTGFPAADFHLQEAEAAHATGPCMCDAGARAPFDAENIVEYVRKLYAGRIRFHRGDHEIAPGLWVHAVPGHSPGLQAVRVFTERGWVVLASDATHLYANMARRDPFPVLWDADAVVRGFDRLAELAPSPDHIIPGHDPAVMRAYPEVMPEIAVRLDRAPLITWKDLA